jgi:hypothetical protein
MVRSVPSSSGADAIDHRMSAERRWSELTPSLWPLPISIESRSFQAPGSASGCHWAAGLNRLATCDQLVCGHDAPLVPQ